MDDSLARRPAARPPRLSAAAADSGANVSLQDGEVTEGIEGQPAREAPTAADRPGAAAAAAGITERRSSAPQVVHQRHMPMEPKKFHIPRKTREKRGELLPQPPCCSVPSQHRRAESRTSNQTLHFNVNSVI